jgi:hypothetical protein
MNSSESQLNARLDREVRMLKFLFIGTFAVVVGSMTLGFARPSGALVPHGGKFEEITVGRINVAGPDGVNRFVLSHQSIKAPFADQELERDVPPGTATMIYCDPKGNEIGGIASHENGRLIALDYADYPLEALILASGGKGEQQGSSIRLMQPPQGEKVDLAAADRGYEKLKALWKSGLDEAAAQAEAEKQAKTDPDLAECLRFREMMTDRITMLVSPQQAGIVLNDREGRERIVIRVDENDEPEIVLFDAEGKEVARLPERKETGSGRN